MATTPEGKVKNKVKALLKKYGVYYEMHVPCGYGAPGLDFNVCCNGFALYIETKAPGKLVTSRQQRTKTDIEKSGGVVFVIDGTANTTTYEELEAWIRTTLEFPKNTK